MKPKERKKNAITIPFPNFSKLKVCTTVLKNSVMIHRWMFKSSNWRCNSGPGFRTPSCSLSSTMKNVHIPYHMPQPILFHARLNCATSHCCFQECLKGVQEPHARTVYVTSIDVGNICISKEAYNLKTLSESRILEFGD